MATWRRFTACAGALPKRSRSSPMATEEFESASAGASANCRSFTAPSSPRSCAISTRAEDFGFFGLAKKKQKGQVLIAHKDVVIETGDHVIVFCLDKKVVKQVEKLFAVGFHFF
jgi:trk system potassium uptake protein TrkA